MHEYGSVLWYAGAHWLLTTSWVEKLLSSYVSKESSRTQPGLGRFVVFQVLKWDRTKAEPIDFSNTACHSQLIVFFLLKLSFSILHDLPSQSSSLWHAATSAVAQGIVSTLFIKKPPPSPLGVPLYIIVKDFRGKQFRVFPPFYFISLTVCSMHDSSHSLTADSLKTVSIIHFFWQGGIIAWGQRDESLLAAQRI